MVTEWRIKQSFILSATGLLKESLDVMESLDISDMPNSVKIEYFSQMVSMARRLSIMPTQVPERSIGLTMLRST